jgi:hypothetical protein
MIGLARGSVRPQVMPMVFSISIISSIALCM